MAEIEMVKTDHFKNKKKQILIRSRGSLKDIRIQPWICIIVPFHNMYL